MDTVNVLGLYKQGIPPNYCATLEHLSPWIGKTPQILIPPVQDAIWGYSFALDAGWDTMMKGYLYA